MGCKRLKGLASQLLQSDTLRTPPVASVTGSGVAYGRPHFISVAEAHSRRGVRKRSVVYVDGFNVYFAIRYTPHRWLNVAKLAALAVPDTDLVATRYFTARIEARADKDAPARQDIYLRALRTVPNLSIHFGQFLSNRVRMTLTQPPLIGPKTVEVWKTEEKGSDVNLATYLLADAFGGRYERAIVVSNDSDLVEPIRMVKGKLALQIVVLSPADRFSKELHDAATAYRRVTDATFKAAQFPETLVDGVGEFHRPPGWDKAKHK